MNTQEYLKYLDREIRKLEIRKDCETDQEKQSEIFRNIINRRLLLNKLKQQFGNRRTECRSFTVQNAADNGSIQTKGHSIIGRPIVYDKRTNIGAFDEIIDSGALNATDLKDVRFLVNHNTDMIPLARSRTGKKSTMQIKLDSNGMIVVVDLDTENNAEAKSLYSAVTRGDISGMSFAFSVGVDNWEDVDSEHPTRHIKSIKRVTEVSAVTFPAYNQTSIQAKGA